MATSSGNNVSTCADPLDPANTKLILALMSSLGGASVLLCTVAIVLVLVLRLYRSLVYRLAAYQVLAALLYGIVCALQILSKDETGPINTPLCQATAFFMMYLGWMKLMFTVWVTAHLFFFAVFYKNMIKWEKLYVLSSVLVPVAISVIPFTTGSYGRAGAWCWTQNWKGNCPLNVSSAGVIEQFTVWYGPAFVLLMVDSLAVVVTAIVLVRRACRYSQDKEWQQHKEALTQMLPLLAYPVTYIILLLVPIATRVYNALSHDPSTVDYALLGTTGACMSLWGLFAGVSLSTHICVMKNRNRSKGPENNKTIHGTMASEEATIDAATSSANTFYEPDRENEIGDLQMHAAA